VKHRLLEIAVETVEAALAAERAGADRVELCSNLRLGGVTSDAALLTSVRKHIQIPVFAMIRPRVGGFVYSAPEFEQMKTSIAIAKNVGANGIVLGILTPDARIDTARTRELISLANPLPVTFHRAFDSTEELSQALEDVLQTGASRILTSGGTSTALEGQANIAKLVAAAGDHLTIVPGAGINAGNILQVAAATQAKEFHSGLSSALPYPRTDYTSFEKEVRKLVAKLESLS
jgi:copper homeostasis protein